MDDSVVVALFRHGLTELNKQKAYLGWTDAPLCDEASSDLANLIFNRPYELVVTSDLKRCLQTANLLFSEQDAIVLQEFREMNFGPWEGKTYAELAGDSYFEAWIGDPFNVTVPGVESYSNFSKRIENGWKQAAAMMTDKQSKRLAIVTHGGVIRHVLSKYAHSQKGFWEWSVPHGNGIEMVWSSKEAFRRDERCTLLREVLLTENQNG